MENDLDYALNAMDKQICFRSLDFTGVAQI